MGNRLSKIVTKTGDKGTTGLADGSRVAKHSARIQAIGTLDELNSFVGLFISELPTDNELIEPYTRVQNDLFDLGGELAMSSASEQVVVLQGEHSERLEALLGAKVTKVKVKKVDLVNDTTAVDVRFSVGERTNRGLPATAAAGTVR